MLPGPAGVAVALDVLGDGEGPKFLVEVLVRPTVAVVLSPMVTDVGVKVEPLQAYLGSLKSPA